MYREDIEKLLGGLPTHEPDSRRERELLETLLAARPQRGSWWSSRVPIWQAAAACLLAGLLGGTLALTQSPLEPNETQRDMAMQRRRPPPPAPVTVSLEESLFASSVTPDYRLDITRWGPPAGRSKGE